MSTTIQKEMFAVQIEKLKAQFDQLRAQTKHKAWDMADVGEKRVDEIGARLQAAERRLEEASASTWDAVKKEFADSWEHLQGDFEELKKVA